MRLSDHGRAAAVAVAGAAWSGLAIESLVALRRFGSVEGAAWVLLRYFTITTNLLLVVVFTGLACARDVHSRMIAGTALSIGLVGCVYHLLLNDLAPRVGAAAVSNFILHTVTPVLGPLYWLVFARKGALRWRDPVGWSIYPLAYLVYALVRGDAEGFYAYPFVDAGRFGAMAVARNCLVIGVFFILAGLVLVMLDRLLVRAPAAGPLGETRD